MLGEKRAAGDPQTLKIFLSNPDLVYAYGEHGARNAADTFRISCKAIYKEVTGFDLEYEQSGKPFENTQLFT